MTLSDSIVELTAQANPTVSSKLAEAPNTAVHDIAEQLFKPSPLPSLLNKLSVKLHPRHVEDITSSDEPTQEDLDRAAACGNFSERPSDLFLKIYAQALVTLEKDPLAGVVSPSLMGSTGVLPLSIISVIPDIIAHMADVIVRAKFEIFFATNFWEAFNSATTITDALRELSKRAGSRCDRVVVKMMYDRGTPKQVVETHQFVDSKTYTGPRVKLPSPEEIPNLDLEVVNFHVPPVGTFHSKYVVVDRRIVILQSNNIQDRVNIEMMTHIEGKIVDSFFDMALLSWNRAMTPPLPSLSNPPSLPTSFDFGNALEDIKKKDLEGAKVNSRALLKEHNEYAAGDVSQGDGDERGGISVYDDDNSAEANRVKQTLISENAVTEHLNTGTKITATEPHSSVAERFTPHILHAPHEPFPMALVNRRPYGKPGHSDVSCPQNAAFLAVFRYAAKKVFVQTPTFNAPPVVEAALAAVKRGIKVTIIADLGFNDEGELLPFQGGTNEMVATEMYNKLETDEQKKLLRLYWYTGKDQRTPLNAKDKSRNCHVKLLIVDDCVGIQGNGNQDVQSWFHSQEINVLVDSPSVCQEWMAGIRVNQNSLLHGELDKDGIWRDEAGKTLPGATGGPKGPFKSLIGVKGAVQRVQGEGGF